MKVIRLLIAVATLAGISQSAHAAAPKKEQAAHQIQETPAQEAERLANAIVAVNAKNMTTATTCPELFANAKNEAFDRLKELAAQKEVQVAILGAYIKEAADTLGLETKDAKLTAIAQKISATYITNQKPTDIAWNYMRLMNRNQQAETRKKNAETDDVIALLGKTAATTIKFAGNTVKQALGYTVTKADNARSTTWAGPVLRGIATAALWKHKNSSMNIPLIGIKSPAVVNKYAYGALMLTNLYLSAAYKNGYINRFLRAYNNTLPVATITETIGGTPDYAAMLS